eukprot:3739536-Rhodomonas_salina.1
MVSSPWEQPARHVSGSGGGKRAQRMSAGCTWLLSAWPRERCAELAPGGVGRAEKLPKEDTCEYKAEGFEDGFPSLV